MKYGVILPGGTATVQLEQAILAEQSGWDGVFVWEAGYGVDAWTLLAAMAASTSRVKLGTVLTPLPWRRPWKVASQVATLDQLSAGRAILTVGVGALSTDLPLTGEQTDLRTRAELLDEGIASRRGIMSIHREPAYTARFGPQHFPASESASDQCVCLPLYTQMTDDEIGRVIDAVRRHAPR